MTVETGASPILNYKIRTDQGSVIGVWADLETIVSASPYEYTLIGLTPGETYSIGIVAINLHGEGLQSESFIAVAGDQPDRPSSIVTIEDHAFIKLTWIAPFDNYLPITSYET